MHGSTLPERAVGPGQGEPRSGRGGDYGAVVDPLDLPLLHTLSRPAVLPDGRVVVAVSRPDLEHNRYDGSLHLFDPAADGAEPRRLTWGGRDREPVLAPDGRTLAFLRTVDDGPGSGKPQVWAMDLDGGEPRRITEHPLGAGTPVFSPDSTRIAYPAAVPEPGRYGTDEKVDAAAEPPRRITSPEYRRDGRGFLGDQPEQLHVAAVSGATSPVRVTAEPTGASDPVWDADGDSLLYVRKVTADGLATEIARIDADTHDGVGERAGDFAGECGALAVHPAGLLFAGIDFTGTGYAGRTTGLFLRRPGAAPVRLTDPETVEVVGAAGPPVAGPDGTVVVAVASRGRVELRAVPLDGEDTPLASLAVVSGQGRAVRSFTAGPAGPVAVIADPHGPGEVVVDGRTVTAFGALLPDRGVRVEELTATAPDGYPVHGFLVLPAGPGPHPVLLDVHGGPHAAYDVGFFDEAQVYAGAGYAVVLPNPRGSAGYGQEHGTTIIGRLGTVDADDVLALLEAACSRSDCRADAVGVMGGSYGGFMTSWLLGHHPDRFVAGISERAVNAWDSFAGSSDIGWFFAANYVGADRDAQWAQSPLASADRITVPLLIIHSEQDWRCPIEQGQRLFAALRGRGAPVEMLLFPGEGHELSRSGRPQHRLQRFEAILRWWSEHLPVTAD
jgi:dipeptidyl aminopeptidase/acylaminoacyl peptidase